MLLEDIAQGDRIDGVVPGESVEILGVKWNGPDAISLAYERANGDMSRVVLAVSVRSCCFPGR